VDYSAVPWTTFTKPEVGHIGLTEQDARKEKKYVTHVIVNLDKMDRAKSEDDRVGFLKIILGKRDRIIGATLISEKAGEMLPIISLAITKKLKLSVFLGLVFSYPTEAEIFKFAALDVMKKKFRPWMKTVIGWLN